jgi:hypothetical protein
MVLRENRAETQRAETQRAETQRAETQRAETETRCSVIAMKECTWFKKHNVELSLP